MQGHWFESARLPHGWAQSVRMEVDGGRIVSIEAGRDRRSSDERHGPGLPGLPNVHSHAFQRAMAGRAERRAGAEDDFWLWRKRMYDLAQLIEPEDLQAIAALAYAEMLQSGFVRVGEFQYVHHTREGGRYENPAEMSAAIVQAAARTGVGLTLLPVFYAHAGFGGCAPEPAQARFVCDIDAYARLVEEAERVVRILEGAVVGIAPHSLRAVTPDELDRLAALRTEAPIHIHIAEQAKEVADCLAWSGRTPVDWLLAHQDVDARWCLVHATHVTNAETSALAASGAVAGLCPITEANLGDGLFPAASFLEKEGAIGIGSDSNVLIDVAEELRLLEYGQRLQLRRRNVLGATGFPTGDRIYDAALSGGARALGVPRPGLEVGRSADFVTLDGSHPALVGSGPEELLGRWIFAGARPVVRQVWLAGRKLVEEGRHLKWDAIADDYRAALSRLKPMLI